MTEQQESGKNLDRRLLREIGIVLILKVIALVGIKLMFFNDPAGNDMDAGQVGNALFGQPETEVHESL